MKQLYHILGVIVATVVLAVSCVDPLEPEVVVNNGFSEGALVFCPEVLGVTPATKTTPGDSSLGENTLTRIDIYVYKENGEEESSLIKHYKLLPEGNQTELNQTTEYLLQSNWRDDYHVNETYTVYAIANASGLPESPSETDLQQCSFESIKDNNNCYEIVRLAEGDPADAMDHRIKSKVFLMDGMKQSWAITNPTGKQYLFNANNNVFELRRAAAKFDVTLKLGIDDPDINSRNSFIERFGLPDQSGLKFTKKTYYDSNKQKIKSEQIIVVGSFENEPTTIEDVKSSNVIGRPRLKFANYMKATYVLSPNGRVPNDFRNTHLWDSPMFFNFSYPTSNGSNGSSEELFKFPYRDVSYSYAFDWTNNEAAEVCPALAVTIRYTTYIQNYSESGSPEGDLISDGGVTNYYRIPLVDLSKNTSTGVHRNYFYQVNAFINTLGTSKSEVEPLDVKVNYKVVPWPVEPNVETDAQATQLFYFVAETSYRLRGDKTQTKYLQYFTTLSDKEGDHYKTEPKISNVKVYYKDQNNQIRTVSTPTTSDEGYTWVSGSSTETQGAYVFIKVLPDNTGNSGNIQVSSNALFNRSVKYITFDAIVNFGEQEVKRKFVVTHFPLDNLQSIPGKWSSYWNLGSSYDQVTTKEYTFDLEVAKSWGSYVTETNYEVSDIEANMEGFTHSSKEYVRRSDSYDNYDDNEVSQATFQSVPQNRRSDANSANNAVEVSSGGQYYYYWGSEVEEVTENDSYDYTTTVIQWIVFIPIPRTVYWKYSSYHCRRFYIEHYYRERYYHEITVNRPSTGSWVDWDRDNGQTYNASDVKYTNNGNNFTAKVFNGSTTKIYAIDVSRSGSNPNYTYSYNMATSQTGGQYHVYTTDNSYTNQTGGFTQLTNNHMYVIQVSNAGTDQYGHVVILGRPNQDANHQSNDNTVSPAFMIASQLGATPPETYTEESATKAAQHCFNYMEVAENGHRFTGWRLPTKAEISYILQYQRDLADTPVFDNVLTGHYYYTLNYITGEDYGRRRAETSFETQNDRTYIRCIRDLTPAEVIDLNSNGTISASNY